VAHPGRSHARASEEGPDRAGTDPPTRVGPTRRAGGLRPPSSGPSPTSCWACGARTPRGSSPPGCAPGTRVEHDRRPHRGADRRDRSGPAQPTLGDADTLAGCEPKALRYRFLHLRARLTHSARRRLRIPESWPWAAAVVAVFANIAATPPDPSRPLTTSPPGEPQLRQRQPGRRTRDHSEHERTRSHSPGTAPAIVRKTGGLASRWNRLLPLLRYRRSPSFVTRAHDVERQRRRLDGSRGGASSGSSAPTYGAGQVVAKQLEFSARVCGRADRLLTSGCRRRRPDTGYSALPSRSERASRRSMSRCAPRPDSRNRSLPAPACARCHQRPPT
jgi:hypothetical protein